MKLWKNYILKGNERFAASDYESAQALYEAAKRQAERLFPGWCDPEQAVSALIVASHNLADLYQEQGKTIEARSVLDSIHQKLLKKLLTTSLNDRRHPALYRGCIETYSALIEHKQSYQRTP